MDDYGGEDDGWGDYGQEDDGWGDKADQITESNT